MFDIYLIVAHYTVDLMIYLCLIEFSRFAGHLIFSNSNVQYAILYIIPCCSRDLEEALEMGMDWSLREGLLKTHLFLDLIHYHTILTYII